MTLVRDSQVSDISWSLVSHGSVSGERVKRRCNAMHCKLLDNGAGQATEKE